MTLSCQLHNCFAVSSVSWFSISLPVFKNQTLTKQYLIWTFVLCQDIFLALYFSSSLKFWKELFTLQLPFFSLTCYIHVPFLFWNYFFWVALRTSECCIQDQVSSYLTVLEYLGYLTPLLYLLLTSLTKSVREVPPSVHIFLFSVITSVIISIIIVTKVPACHSNLIK